MVAPASELLAPSGELFGSSLDVERTLSQLAELVVPRMADWAAVDVLDDNDNFRRVGVAHVDPDGAELLRELHERYPLRPTRAGCAAASWPRSSRSRCTTSTSASCAASRATSSTTRCSAGSASARRCGCR